MQETVRRWYLCEFTAYALSASYYIISYWYIIRYTSTLSRKENQHRGFFCGLRITRRPGLFILKIVSEEPGLHGSLAHWWVRSDLSRVFVFLCIYMIYTAAHISTQCVAWWFLSIWIDCSTPRLGRCKKPCEDHIFASSQLTCYLHHYVLYPIDILYGIHCYYLRQKIITIEVSTITVILFGHLLVDLGITSWPELFIFKNISEEPGLHGSLHEFDPSFFLCKCTYFNS